MVSQRTPRDWDHEGLGPAKEVLHIVDGICGHHEEGTTRDTAKQAPKPASRDPEVWEWRDKVNNFELYEDREVTIGVGEALPYTGVDPEALDLAL